MTKDELLSRLSDVQECYNVLTDSIPHNEQMYILRNSIEELYSSIIDLFQESVVIPKGDTLQLLKTELIEFGGERKYWEDVLTIHDHSYYRIKPSEPIYE